MSQESAYYIVGTAGTRYGIKKIKSKIGMIKGIKSISVNPNSSKVAIDYDSTGITKPQIEAEIRSLGYDVREAGAGAAYGHRSESAY